MMNFEPCQINSLDALSISDNNTNCNTKIYKGNHVPGSFSLSCNKNSDSRYNISCKFMIQCISLVLRESVQLLREFLKHLQIILLHDTIHTLNGFTTFACSTLASVHENTMTSFDTDSSFWVCDTSATGHICNNRTLFFGNLVPSMYIVRAAMGTSEPTLMGMVQLRITDDDGEKHTFILTHVIFMPTSPVNLL
jgi:hypothetical protein